MSEEGKTLIAGPGGPLESDKAEKVRTMELSVRESMAWSVMWGFGESYISPFAIALQASNTAMALLGTLPAIGSALAQMAGASLTERFSLRRPLMVGCTLTQAFCYLPLFVLPFLFPSAAAPCVVAIFTLMIAANGFAAPAWTSLMGDIVPTEIRGKYFGRRMRYTLLVMVLTMSAAGIIMSEFKKYDRVWVGFGLLFGIALLARSLSAYMLSRHYDPPYRADKDTYFSFFDFVRRAPKSNFAKFTFAVGLMTGMTMIAAPFFGVYMLRDMHWSYLQFTIMTVVGMVTQALVLPWWGSISDRHGNKIVITATSLLLPVTACIWAFTTNFYVLLVFQVVGGVGWAGFGLAVSNFIFDAVTPPKRPRVISYFGVVNGFFSLLGGAVIGALLAERLPSSYSLAGFKWICLSSLPAVFLISGIGRLFVALMLISSFKEVRVSEPITTRELLWRITSGEPIFGQLAEIVDFVSSPLKRGK